MMSRLQKVYYINLDRKPDRRRNIEETFSGDSRLSRIAAVDGVSQRDVVVDNRAFFKNVDLQIAIDHELDANPNKVEPNYQCYNTHIHFAVMGNAISHVRTWEAIVADLENDDDIALVLQDDAMVWEQMFTDMDMIISKFPEDAKVVWLSRHEWAIGGHFVKVDFTQDPDVDKHFEKKQNDTIGNLRPSCNPCSLAYLVTKKGAAWLIQNTPSVTGAMDNHMNYILYTNGIHYATYTPYVTSDTKNFRSDIFT